MKNHKFLTPVQTIISVLVLLLFSGAVLFLSAHNDSRRFVALTTGLFQQEMLSNTLNMHYTLAYPEHFGLGDYEPLLPGYDRDASIVSLADTQKLLTSLYDIDVTHLSKRDAYTYQLLTRALENTLAQNSCAYYAEPLSPHSGMQSQLPILLAEYTFRRRQDVEDYLALLDQTDTYFASLLAYEQEKKDAGLLMSRTSLEKVKDQCDTILTAEELDQGSHFLQSSFAERLQPLLDTGEITAEEADKFMHQNDRLLRTVLLPAYVALADGLFVLEDASIPCQGLAKSPEGKRYYESLLRSETGSYRDIEDIRQLLKETFKQEYLAIYELVQVHPDLTEYARMQERKTTFPLQKPDEMLADLQLRMAKDFPVRTAPGKQAPVTVKAVSPNLQDYCAPAFYLTAPLDDTDNNVIYINQKNSTTPLELYTTLAHEGFPGHLYQTVYCHQRFAARDENPIRQILWYGGYQEGWALYVEFKSYEYASELLGEKGLETEALCAELEKHNRSLQLCLYSLLDLMIHYDGIDITLAAKLLETVGITDPASADAIYTYIVEEPCNYPKYYLGYLEILELQKSSANQWQSDYSDLCFHTFLLDLGPSDFATLGEALEASSISSR